MKPILFILAGVYKLSVRVRPGINAKPPGPSRNQLKMKEFAPRAAGRPDRRRRALLYDLDIVFQSAAGARGAQPRQIWLQTTVIIGFYRTMPVP